LLQNQLCWQKGQIHSVQLLIDTLDPSYEIDLITQHREAIQFHSEQIRLTESELYKLSHQYMNINNDMQQQLNSNQQYQWQNHREPQQRQYDQYSEYTTSSETTRSPQYFNQHQHNTIANNNQYSNTSNNNDYYNNGFKQNQLFNPQFNKYDHNYYDHDTMGASSNYNRHSLGNNISYHPFNNNSIDRNNTICIQNVRYNHMKNDLIYKDIELELLKSNRSTRY
jgi:hypothetical protein